MLEGHDRSEDRHFRRPAQDLRAVNRVPAHDLELRIRQFVRLVQDVLRRADLADVVHERGEPQLAQQPAVDPERPRLAHREDGDVHHVRERVVVVTAHGGERHERGPIMGDGIGQPFDCLQRRRQIGFAVPFGAFPHRLRGGDGAGVELPDGRHVAADAVRPAVVGRDASDADMSEFPVGPRRIRLAERGEGKDEGAELLLRHAPIERDAFDLVILQPLDQFGHPQARA